MCSPARRGFVDMVKELELRFPDPTAIEKESDKKAFAKLFGEYLRVENVLQNYDEFASLKALQNVDTNEPAAVEEFKDMHYLSDEDLAALQTITVPSERKISGLPLDLQRCARVAALRKIRQRQRGFNH